MYGDPTNGRDVLRGPTTPLNYLITPLIEPNLIVEGKLERKWGSGRISTVADVTDEVCQKKCSMRVAGGVFWGKKKHKHSCCNAT